MRLQTLNTGLTNLPHARGVDGSRFGTQADTITPATIQAVIRKFSPQQALTYIYDGQDQKGSIGVRASGQFVLNISNFRHPQVVAIENQMVQSAEKQLGTKLSLMGEAFIRSNHLELLIDPKSGQITPRIQHLTFQMNSGVIPQANYAQVGEVLLQQLLKDYTQSATGTIIRQ